MALLAKERGNLQEAEKWYRQSLALFGRLEDDYGLSETRTMLGDLYVRMGRLGDARKELEQAIIIAKRLNLKPKIADCYVKIGDTAAAEGGFKEARDWFEEALAMYEELKHEEEATHVRKRLQLLEQVERGGNKATKKSSDKKSGGILRKVGNWLRKGNRKEEK